MRGSLAAGLYPAERRAKDAWQRGVKGCWQHQIRATAAPEDRLVDGAFLRIQAGDPDGVGVSVDDTAAEVGKHDCEADIAPADDAQCPASLPER